MVRQQRLDLGPQVGVIGPLQRSSKLLAHDRVEARRLQEYFLDAVVFFAAQISLPRRARGEASARMIVHSFSTVRFDRPNASATSSTVRPAKNRSSTIPPLARVELGQLFDRFVDGQQVGIAVGGQLHRRPA